MTGIFWDKYLRMGQELYLRLRMDVVMVCDKYNESLPNGGVDDTMVVNGRNNGA